MSKFFEMLQEEIKSNPRLQQLAQAAKRDGFALITAPERAVAGLTRAVGSGIEGVADLAGDVTEFIDRNAPRIEVGSGDSEIEIDPIGMKAKMDGAVAGLVGKAGEAISNLKSPAESALEAMDRQIGALGGSGSGGGVAGAAGAAGARAGAKAAGAKAAGAKAAGAKAAADEFNPPDFDDLSPEEQEAHRERKRKRIASKKTPTPSAKAPLAKRSTAKDRMLAAMDKMDGTPTASEDPTGEEFDTAFDDEMPEGTDGVSSDMDVSSAAKAVPVDDAQAMDLFKTVHGGDFDPKSSMDKTKLAKIKENLVKDEYKGLSPNQFALRMYREAA